jgi:oligopeptide/dipeptide ABC transporter ATP-binding protein
VTGARMPKLAVIEGQPPVLCAAPVGCPFRDRCPRRMEICATLTPLRRDVGAAGHDVACHYDYTEAVRA